MAKGPQGAIPVAPSLCSFAGPSWRFRLGPQEMNLSAATLLSQSVETLPPPIPTCHSHDCKLADPRKLPGPSTSQRWDCLPSNQARIRGIEHPQLLSLQPSLRPTAHEYRSFLCLLKTADPGLGRKRQGQRRPGAGGEGVSRHHHRGYVNRCVNDIRRRPSQPLIQWRFHPHTVHRDRRLRSTQGPSDA